MSDSAIPPPHAADWLAGRRIIVCGKLSGMGRRQLRKVVAARRGTLVAAGNEAATLVIVGDESWPRDAEVNPAATLDDATRGLVRSGRAELLAENAFWQRLGMVDDTADVRRLYTPAMLASFLGESLASVRTWLRSGLLQPVCYAHKLPYFDFTQVTAARRIAELIDAGQPLSRIVRTVAALALRFPEVAHPLGELPLVVSGRLLLLRQGEGLVDVAGQYRLDFDASGSPDGDNAGGDAVGGKSVGRAAENHSPSPPVASVLTPFAFHDRVATPAELMAVSAELQDQGDLAGAIDAARAALAAGGPNAEICFSLAEMLYRQGDRAAARERYYMAIELDEDFVEARANLGCVLAESGEFDLAVAALEGALECHPTYADAHYHLARLLDEHGQTERAETHWQRFLELAPDSPWADEARQRSPERRLPR